MGQRDGLLGRVRAGVACGLLLIGSCGDESAAAANGPDPDGGPDAEVDAGDEPAHRCESYEPLRSAFFGDTHVHTALSLDAALQGTRLRPLDAYRFARGERVGIQPYDADGESQRSLKLRRPLDFAIVTDHAEFLGHVNSCSDPSYEGYESEACEGYRDEPELSFITFNVRLAASQDEAASPEPCAGEACETALSDAWKEIQDAAEAALDGSDQCTFTTFVGYEWTGNPGTRNLHRNVVFAGDKVPRAPVSYFDAPQEEQLWQRLVEDCEQGVDGCEVLTIPHNSNLSAGLMFERVKGDGEPFDAEYARMRARMEPLVEVFQHKGSSECLSPMGSDESCGFEMMPFNTLAGANLGIPESDPAPADFVRDALQQGLRFQQRLGVNPFAYGLIASTDTHIGAAGAVDEESFPGHGGAGRPAIDALPEGLIDHVWFNPGGLSVLWAEENSREALFAAMRRREAYGTSGPRIRLRFFGGLEYEDLDCEQSDLVARAYEGGVPMGGELELAADAAHPRFVVRAQRDAGTRDRPGGPLSHLQIVKGWLQGDELHTEVFDVAGEPEGDASVEVSTCERRGEGHDALCAVWEDAAFDASQHAFYYARAFETPSCRWHAYACNAAGVDCEDEDTITEGFEPCCDEAFPKVQRERAWSSPIWLLPESGGSAN